MNEIEILKKCILGELEHVEAFNRSMRVGAEILRDNKLQPSVILAIAGESAEVSMLSLLSRFDRGLLSRVEAIREYRKELMLAMHRAKNKGI